MIYKTMFVGKLDSVWLTSNFVWEKIIMLIECNIMYMLAYADLSGNTMKHNRLYIRCLHRMYSV